MTSKAAQARAAAKWRSTYVGRATALLRGAFNRAKAKGVECSITRDWVLERLLVGRCEVTGMLFCWESGSPWAPSLDQIKPRGGYTTDNTRLVVRMLNTMKGQYSDEQVMELAHALVQKGK